MHRTVAFLLLCGLVLWARPALPCGGGFGDELAVGPSQKIVVVHRDGTQTYIFRPHFCGAAADFGLILPVPGKLVNDPQLGDKDLVAQLEQVTAPTVKTEQICEGLSNGGWGGAGAGGGEDGLDGGVQVVDAGQVGIFDWVLLKADSAAAFTDWLDANGYPYDAGSEKVFAHYVAAAWYFVAFKVTAAKEAPPDGLLLCGDLGPIQLAFSSQGLVIPARIATAGPGAAELDYAWRVFAVTKAQVRSQNDGEISSELRFSGALGQQDLSPHQAVAKIAKQGEWLTELQLGFYGGELSDDIALGAHPNPAAFRRTEYKYVEVPCPDGGVGGAGASGAAGPGGAGTGGAAASPAEPEEDGCAIGAGARGGLPAGAVLLALLGLGWRWRRRDRRLR
ncbi:MAG: DUF2330 domain-containing protein [Deltaproteobacteria bacterium]|nr:DUF2330 domain-containing protein [Deltaproteobacteria bacterium]